MTAAESLSDATPGGEASIPGTKDVSAMWSFLLSQREAAELLGISPRTLARRSADGTIPSFLIGRRRVYSRVRLAEWVARQAA